MYIVQSVSYTHLDVYKRQVITIPAVISYDKIDEEDLFEDSVAGYTATLESGDIVTFYCFNAKNKS